jgi:transcriptional regulator with XRE-family HTH domain
MGWTRQNAAVSVLLAMDEHRREAGRRLAQLRDSRGWSQEELAYKAGVSTKTVSRFENGRHDGRRSTIKKFADALEVSEAQLVGPPPNPLGLGQRTPEDQELATLVTALRREVERLSAQVDRLMQRDEEPPAGGANG